MFEEELYFKNDNWTWPITYLILFYLDWIFILFEVDLECLKVQ